MLEQLKPYAVPALVGLGSFGVGFALGYRFKAKKKVDLLCTVIDDLASQVDAAESEIRRREEQIEALQVQEGQREKIDYFSIAPSEEAMSVVETVDTNAFDDGWDWEEETEGRTTDAPYILHIDEWAHEESGYRHHSLTWYSGDKVLVDEQNVPVPNHDRLVGHLRFGHGSGDPNIVFIRNDKHKAEYEVIRSFSSYAVDVLGAELEAAAEAAELRHMHRPGKFKLD